MTIVSGLSCGLLEARDHRLFLYFQHLMQMIPSDMPSLSDCVDLTVLIPLFPTSTLGLLVFPPYALIIPSMVPHSLVSV